MQKEILRFSIKLLGFSLLLCAIHYYILFIFFADIVLFLPIWSIYLFNSILVLIVFLIMSFMKLKDSDKLYNTFLMVTLAKMGLVIVFLLPLFAGKSEHSRIEVVNFFIPYFFFLVFEIKVISKFLKKE